MIWETRKHTSKLSIRSRKTSAAILPSLRIYEGLGLPMAYRLPVGSLLVDWGHCDISDKTV